MSSRGIIYEYEDGGKYCGEWENDAAHGHGVCTGPKGNGLFEGLWQKGNQTSGVFTWPNGQKYTGKWQYGLREGLGRETKQDGTEYSGDFTKDSRGPFGVLRQPNGVVYRGMWSKGVQNGEGTEIYVDGGEQRGGERERERERVEERQVITRYIGLHVHQSVIETRQRKATTPDDSSFFPGKNELPQAGLEPTTSLHTVQMFYQLSH